MHASNEWRGDNQRIRILARKCFRRSTQKTGLGQTAGLEHPAILPVHQVGEHEGLPWFTMKLADGGSLAQRREELAGRWRDIAMLVATLADAVQ